MQPVLQANNRKTNNIVCIAEKSNAAIRNMDIEKGAMHVGKFEIKRRHEQRTLSVTAEQ